MSRVDFAQGPVTTTDLPVQIPRSLARLGHGLPVLGPGPGRDLLVVEVLGEIAGQRAPLLGGGVGRTQVREPGEGRHGTRLPAA